ncbi:hypothetical protein FQN60_017942, partial [Etheostoma spectabile]
GSQSVKAFILSLPPSLPPSLSHLLWRGGTDVSSRGVAMETGATVAFQEADRKMLNNLLCLYIEGYVSTVCRSKKRNVTERSQNKMQQCVVRVSPAAYMDIHNTGSLSTAVRSDNQPLQLMYQGEPCEDDYPPLPAYQSDPDPEKKEVYIVQVKGLPWSCSAQDLLQFFPECRIRDGVKGIHLTVDRLGRSSGQAFIEMEHEEDVSKALEKHRHYLGPRYVEVYEVTNSDAEAILKKAVQAPAENGVVRLRGLPFSCTEADIVQFFSGLDIVENGITFVTDHKGRNSGEAFTSTQSANRRTGSASQTRTGSAQGSASPLHYIHMRGLPFQVSGEDIVKFFSPLIVSKILIECGPEGRLSGEADVYFSCHQDALTAIAHLFVLMLLDLHLQTLDFVPKLLFEEPASDGFTLLFRAGVCTLKRMSHSDEQPGDDSSLLLHHQRIRLIEFTKEKRQALEMLSLTRWRVVEMGVDRHYRPDGKALECVWAWD